MKYYKEEVIHRKNKVQYLLYEDKELERIKISSLAKELFDAIKNNESVNTFGPFFLENQDELLSNYENAQSVYEKLKVILTFSANYPAQSFDFFYYALDYDLYFFGLKFFVLGII